MELKGKTYIFIKIKMTIKKFYYWFKFIKKFYEKDFDLIIKFIILK